MKQRPLFQTNNQRKTRQGPGLLFLLLLLFLVTLACRVPDLPLLETPSPEPRVSPTPLGDTISYLVPAYTTNLQPGETVPGTQLTYVGRTGDALEVQIGGQTAIKRPGDSFYWSGVIGPSIFGDFRLRLATTVFGSLPVAGPVELVIFFPQPVQEPLLQDLDERLKFSNIVLDYSVPVNGTVPGTTLQYLGLDQQGVGGEGTRLARMGGLAGYPNLAVGDSLVWNGRLHNNVWVRYNLRALSFDEENLRLVGTAELWVTN